MMYKKIFFVGIKGVGLAPLAIVAKEAGFEVEGSDVAEEFITDKGLSEKKIPVVTEFVTDALKKFFTGAKKEKILVIYTAAHNGSENPQVVFARKEGIKCINYGEALGLFMSGVPFTREISGVSVAGSHGKTTITALLATCLVKLGMDPSYVIGTGRVFPIGLPGHYGKGKYFVAEADEYAADPVSDPTAKFLYQSPFAAIFNNIDFDHPDMFADIESVEDVFRSFSQKIQKNGIFVVNGDDTRLKNLTNNLENTIKVVTYGSSPENSFYIKRFHESGTNCFFSVESNSISLGDFSISIPGYHNAKNALSCIALLSELGVSIAKISEVLPLFLGTMRRMEKIGTTTSGTVLIDDYAHHPQEIKATLTALKAAYPAKKLVCIFQAHTYSRTKALLPEFASSFYDAAELIIIPTFSSAREEKSEGSDDEFINEFRKIGRNVSFFKTQADVVEYLGQLELAEGALIVTMGAGDVYKIGYAMKMN